MTPGRRETRVKKFLKIPGFGFELPSRLPQAPGLFNPGEMCYSIREGQTNASSLDTDRRGSHPVKTPPPQVSMDDSLRKRPSTIELSRPRRRKWKYASGLLAALLFGLFFWPPADAAPPPAADGVVSVQCTDESGISLGQVKLELVRSPGAMVETILTDSTGRAEFRHVTGGNYFVRATKDGFAPAQIEVNMRPNQASFPARIQMKAEGKPNDPRAKISVRELSIPGKAHDEFLKGVEFLKGKNDPQRSIEHFQRAIHDFPDYYEAYFLLGMAQVATNSSEDAIGSLRKAIGLKASFLEPYYPLGVLLETKKDYDGAEHVLQAAFEQDPKGWRWPFEMARCLASTKQWKQALEYGQKAHALPDAPTKVHLLLADLYSNTGDPVKAVAELEEFEKLDPQSPYISRVEQALPQLRERAAQITAGPARN
jgi:hypothetical protein